MLILEDVDARYPDGTTALSGISLTVRAGEICAVLGRVGAEDSLPLVEPLLDDPDADVRSGAAEAVLMILE